MTTNNFIGQTFSLPYYKGMGCEEIDFTVVAQLSEDIYMMESGKDWEKEYSKVKTTDLEEILSEGKSVKEKKSVTFWKEAIIEELFTKIEDLEDELSDIQSEEVQLENNIDALETLLNELEETLYEEENKLKIINTFKDEVFVDILKLHQMHQDVINF